MDRAEYLHSVADVKVDGGLKAVRAAPGAAVLTESASRRLLMPVRTRLAVMLPAHLVGRLLAAADFGKIIAPQMLASRIIPTPHCRHDAIITKAPVRRRRNHAMDAVGRQAGQYLAAIALDDTYRHAAARMCSTTHARMRTKHSSGVSAHGPHSSLRFIS